MNYEGADRIDLVLESAKQLKKAHGFQDNRPTATKSYRATGHTEHNGGGNIDVLPIQNAGQAHTRHHNIANYSQLHHRNSITDFNATTRQQQQQQAQQLAAARQHDEPHEIVKHELVKHDMVKHDMHNGIRNTNVRITNAHLTGHHVNLNHTRGTQLKRGISTIDEDEHPEKKFGLDEQHPNRPPLTRGDSLPAVSLAVSYVQDRSKDKHPVRAPSFETATTFKPNGE